MEEYIRVMARIRPSKYGSDEPVLTGDGESTILVSCSDGYTKGHKFDCVFGPESTQDDVFAGLGRDAVDGVLSGINGTIFAYGQTGSGKTFTMLGPTDNAISHEQKGVIPRSLEHLFTSLEIRAANDPTFSFSVTCTFIELYNEGLTDLLSPNGTPVTIRGDEKKIVFQGATTETVTSAHGAMKLLNVGWENRRIAETAMNKESSRSHAIFVVDVTLEERGAGLVNICEARLNLVDLAGSERQANTGCSGKRLKEAGKINQSLTTLGRVIRILSACMTSSKKHVPYRDSRLTYMLRDSLGGNSRTAVVVNLHPDREHLAESLSTLQFADACGKVKNSAVVNREIAGVSVAALKEEITRLRQELDICKEVAERDVDKKVIQIENDRDSWRDRALDCQKTLANLRIEMDFRMRLSRFKDIQETEKDALTNILSHYDTLIVNSIEDYDKFAVLGELEQAKSQLESEKAERESLEQKLRNVQDESRHNFSVNSPVAVLNGTMERFNIESTPSFVMPDVQSPVLSAESQQRMQVISVEHLTDLEVKTRSLEQQLEEQKMFLDTMKSELESREALHCKAVAALHERISNEEKKSSLLAAEVSMLKSSRATAEEQRRALEFRLIDVSNERDSMSDTLHRIQSEKDEIMEDNMRLNNELETLKIVTEELQNNKMLTNFSFTELGQRVFTKEIGVQVGRTRDYQLFESLKNQNCDLKSMNLKLEVDINSLKCEVDSYKEMATQRSSACETLQTELDAIVGEKQKISEELKHVKSKRRREKEEFHKFKEEAREKQRELEQSLADSKEPPFFFPTKLQKRMWIGGSAEQKFTDKVNEMKSNFSFSESFSARKGGAHSSKEKETGLSGRRVPNNEDENKEPQ